MPVKPGRNLPVDIFSPGKTLKKHRGLIAVRPMAVHISRSLEAQLPAAVHFLLCQSVQIGLHIIVIGFPALRNRLINIVQSFHYYTIVVAVIIQKILSPGSAFLVVP